ncbi:unnamed protein product, partial [Polarella glacialis]
MADIAMRMPAPGAQDTDTFEKMKYGLQSVSRISRNSTAESPDISGDDMEYNFSRADLLGHLADHRLLSASKDRQIESQQELLVTLEQRTSSLEATLSAAQLRQLAQNSEHNDKVARLMLELSIARRETECLKRKEPLTLSESQKDQLAVSQSRLNEQSLHLSELQQQLVEELSRRKATQYELIQK